MATILRSGKTTALMDSVMVASSWSGATSLRVRRQSVRADTMPQPSRAALTSPRQGSQKSLILFGQFHIHRGGQFQQRIGDKRLIVAGVVQNAAQDWNIVFDVLKEGDTLLQGFGPSCSGPICQRIHDLVDEIGFARLFEETQTGVPVFLCTQRRRGNVTQQHFLAG